MNRGTVVRVDAMPVGLMMRIWVDDEFGSHVTVCEVEVPDIHLANWAREVDAEKARAAQYQLEFDQ